MDLQTYNQQKVLTIARYGIAALVVLALAFLGIVMSSHAITHADTTTNNGVSATTTTPVLSSIVVTPTSNGTGATITWTTNVAADSQIMYGLTSSYTASTTLDTNNVTSHSVGVSGLTANTLYHFAIVSHDSVTGNTTTSSDMTFTTANPSTTTSTSTTPTSSDITNLQNQITTLNGLVTTLQNQVATLQQQVANLINNQGTGGTGTTTTGTSTPPVTNPTGNVTPASMTVSVGSSVDFSGRNFGIEEPVTVSLNGSTVTTAHADGGGNFSTGSLSVPSTPGTYSYTLRGNNSGITGTSVITVQ